MEINKYNASKYSQLTNKITTPNPTNNPQTNTPGQVNNTQNEKNKVLQPAVSLTISDAGRLAAQKSVEQTIATPKTKSENITNSVNQTNSPAQDTKPTQAAQTEQRAQITSNISSQRAAEALKTYNDNIAKQPNVALQAQSNQSPQSVMQLLK